MGGVSGGGYYSLASDELVHHNASVRLLLRALRAALDGAQRAGCLLDGCERVLAHRREVHPDLLELGALESRGGVALGDQLRLYDGELRREIRGD